MCIGLHVKYQLFLSCRILMKPALISTDLRKIRKYQISWTSVQCCSVTKLTVVFRNVTKSPKQAATRQTDPSKIRTLSGMAGADVPSIRHYIKARGNSRSSQCQVVMNGTTMWQQLTPTAIHMFKQTDIILLNHYSCLSAHIRITVSSQNHIFTHT